MPSPTFSVFDEKQSQALPATKITGALEVQVHQGGEEEEKEEKEEEKGEEKNKKEQIKTPCFGHLRD